MKRHILIDVPDRKGLIFRVSQVLLAHSISIIANQEFVDHKSGHFFMRTEIEGEAEDDALLKELKDTLPVEAKIRILSKYKKDVVILVTKETHCIGDLLIRHFSGELNANIKAMVGNWEVMGDLAEKFGIPFEFVPHTDVPRKEHEKQVLAAVKKYEPEYLVLAKYMRILSPEFVSHYPNRIINIHHSFLPAFIGANPYKQAYNRGVKIIGATAHFVNEDLDEGPIIAQRVLPVDHSHSVRDMALAGKDVEKIALAQALKLVFEDRVFVHGNKTIIFD